MKFQRAIAVFAVSGLAVVTAGTVGCGDDTRECGPGTRDVDGVCVPESMTTCGDGTKLENGLCVVDPVSCQAGTVLIASRCVDPTKGLVVDLEESSEPNAIGIADGVEESPTPAGTITLKPIGEVFVVHGHITPFRDADGDGDSDPDVDTYLINVAGPALLDVTVDGIGGAQGAFYAIGDPAGPFPLYERYGLNLTGDTSRRRLFLPVAGRYELAIADTRSLAIGNNPPGPAGSGGAAGGPSAEYYATITAVAIPAPSPITLSGGMATRTGTITSDDVTFFTTVPSSAQVNLRLAMPRAAAAASVIAFVADQLAAYDDETPGSDAEGAVTGITPGASLLIVVDTAYNYGPAAEPFTLTVQQN